MWVLPVLLVALLLPAPEAAAQSASFTINVVSARDMGCSPDFFTSPDLRVRVLVNGAPVLVTSEGSDQAEPVFAATALASATLPATIEVEVEEGEPAGFFGSRTTYQACGIGPAGETRASFVYDGEGALPVLLRGGGDHAAEVHLVVGHAPTPVPQVSWTATTDEATLRWDTHQNATGHRIAMGGAGRLVEASYSGNQATVRGLCDNSDYRFRVIHDTSTWHVSSADVEVHTRNVAPQAPTVLSASRGGNVTFESPTTHDVARYEVHASSASTFTPSSETLRKSERPFLAHDHVTVYDVPFRASDTTVIVRVVDTGDLHADSAPFAIGAPERAASSGARGQCGATFSSVGGSGSSTGEPLTSRPPPQGGEPAPRHEVPPCCIDVDVSIDLPGAPAPRVESGTTVQLQVANRGNVTATLTFTVVDAAGDVRFLGTGATGVRIAAGATELVPVRVEAEAGTRPQRAIEATLEVQARESGLVRDAGLLVDVRATAFLLLDGTAEVRLPAGTHKVVVGGTARTTFTVVNHGETSLDLELQGATALRADASLRLTGVPADGFRAEPEVMLLRIAPGAREDVAVTLRAPAAAAGERVVAQVDLLARADGRVEQAALEFPIEVMAATATSPLALDLGEAGVAVGVAVGAGTVAVAGAAAVFGRRDAVRFAWAAALYTRLTRSDTLGHAGRETIQRLVGQTPGICYSDLKRETGMNTGALVHHLRALERAGLVTSRREGAFRRFYAVGSAPRTVTFVPVDAGLTPMQARVVRLLREEPLTQSELAARLGLSQQGTSHHVKQLERAGRIEAQFDGRVWRYAVVERVDVPR